ncbi:hypothetical protein [Flavobacterium sp. KACC 22761]|uniref:hypothetical protein n=1 Tax=Flavobacterium sp. KACC 22761 TaxID=3092665 RepID=UPI002A765DDB|nr:hypothetical protein [Flavobacterium sp. KACC 22761]WPO77241.1 hypothetical protein SCB73_13305 [Flavobacterium sp. KACC 22761]
MRKNYFLCFLTLFTTMLFGQTVTLTPTTVNGTNYSSGAINLASTPYSTIALGVKVEIPANVAVGDDGTLKVYFSKGPALGAGVAIGGDGGLLYFGGAKVATKSFVINLNWTDFPTSGGYIFAEYKSTKAYNSSSIAVIKNTTMTTGTTLNPPADAPNPTNITNTVCCNQTVRLGDKPAPIAGSNYLNPYKNEPYGISYSWSGDGNVSTPVLSFEQNTLNLDYVPTIGSFTIYRSLGYSYINDRPNKSNTATITVVPSPIISNEISIVDVPTTDNFIEIINTNPKSIVGGRSDNSVNLNILQAPFHVPQRGDNIVNVERYEWEYAKTNIALGGNKYWKTIEGENSPSLNFFNPSDITNNEDNYYLVRRVAVYQNIKRVSNSLKILLRTVRDNNNICCDQILDIPSAGIIESPNSFIGSTPSINRRSHN